MTALLPWTLIGLAVAGAAPDARQARFVPASERLPKLLALYRQFGFPLPPADALLVRQRVPAGFAGRNRPVSRLTFLIVRHDFRHPLTTSYASFDHDYIEPRSTFEAVQPNPGAVSDESTHDDPFLAVQCQARGWTALAEAVLNRWDGSRQGRAEDHMALVAWHYWAAKIAEPGSDWRLIARHLRTALATPAWWVGDRERHLLYSLELSLAPARSRPGSVDALLDDLIERGAEPDRIGLGIGPVQRLAERGFDAVPTVLGHLGDERLTRWKGSDGSGCGVCDRGYNLRVADVASDFIFALREENTGPLVRGPGPPRIGHEEVLTWWTKAWAEGEEKYLVRTVLTKDTDATFANHVALIMLAKRYPNRLPEVVRRMVESRPKMVWWPVVYITAASELPAEEQRRLFLETCARKDLGRYVEALAYLPKPENSRLRADLLNSIPAAMRRVLEREK